LGLIGYRELLGQFFKAAHILDKRRPYAITPAGDEFSWQSIEELLEKVKILNNQTLFKVDQIAKADQSTRTTRHVLASV
jgi:hypothetical protein